MYRFRCGDNIIKVFSAPAFQSPRCCTSKMVRGFEGPI